MKKIFTYTLILFSLAGAISCKKELPGDEQQGAKRLTDIAVPAGFDWKTTREVKFSVSITDNSYGERPQSIAIYDTDGALLAKGFGTPAHPFETKLLISKTIGDVIIVKTAPDQKNMSKRVTLSSDRVAESFGTFTAAGYSDKSGFHLSGGPDCSANQNISIISGQWVTVSNNQTVSVTGSNKTLNVSFDGTGGTLKICGTNITVENVNRNANNFNIIVTDASSGTRFGSLELSSAGQKFENYSDVTFSGNFSSPGVVNNYGTMTVQSGYNVNSSSTHTNYNTLTVRGTMVNNTGTTFNNEGKVTANQLKVQGTFNNNCQLYVTGSMDDALNIDATLNNENYIEVTDGMKLNSSGNLWMKTQAYAVAKRLVTIDGAVRGSGTTSLLKITGSIDQNRFLNPQSQTTKFYGPLNVCYTPATIPATLFDATAKQACDTYIPTSSCILSGNGTNPTPPVDTDGDGVADNLDDAPNDPTVTGISYYPSSASDAGATVAFEDMWPKKGDYDMNDVVISYRLVVLTKFENGVNKVARIRGNYRLYARGGVYQNGFGIEFPVAASKVTATGAATMESGQTNAVAILFTNSHNQMQNYNTKPGEALSPDVNYEFELTVTDGPSIQDFGVGEYNPFIWNSALGRGAEIHLPNKKPTSKANLSLFGTGDDRSVPAQGKYYISNGNYPWAISMGVKDFAYPIEGKDISSAYLKLAAWISSGGTTSTDWFSNTASGYRNTSNIFSR
jgi:LruC domain-containing protein